MNEKPLQLEFEAQFHCYQNGKIFYSAILLDFKAFSNSIRANLQYACLLCAYLSFSPPPPIRFQIRIAALNAASTAADESQDPQRSRKSQTKEAQV